MERRLPEHSSLDHLVPGALAGDAQAVRHLVLGLRDQLYNLALRMLWHPEDAEDATQEILLKILTNLKSFRGASSVRTWAYSVAANHLVSHRKKEASRPSFEDFAEDLSTGLDRAVPPEADERLLEEEVKIGCTLGLLQCLDREHRLAYVLGEIMEMPGPTAAAAAGTSQAAYRKRLSRARDRIREFMKGNCGIVNPSNPCRCRRRIGRAIELGRVNPERPLFIEAQQPSDAAALVAEVHELERAAALYRSHPRYGCPEGVSEVLEEIIESGRYRILR